jgi:hypothetical protein
MRYFSQLTLLSSLTMFRTVTSFSSIVGRSSVRRASTFRPSVTLNAKAGQAEVILVGCGAPNRGMGWYHGIQVRLDKHTTWALGWGVGRGRKSRQGAGYAMVVLMGCLLYGMSRSILNVFIFLFPTCKISLSHHVYSKHYFNRCWKEGMFNYSACFDINLDAACGAVKSLLLSDCLR